MLYRAFSATVAYQRMQNAMPSLVGSVFMNGIRGLGKGVAVSGFLCGFKNGLQKMGKLLI